MLRTTSIVTIALLALAAEAANLTFYTDTFCSTLHSTVQWNDTLVCHPTSGPTLPKSVVFHLSDFESADLTGTVYTSTNCSPTCGADGDFVVEVENESPNPEYPIANGQCVQAQPYNATFGSYQFASFR